MRKKIGLVLSVAMVVGLCVASKAGAADGSQALIWGEFESGDCIMESGSKLTVYASGAAQFDATTYTNHTHSGDVWHQTVKVRDRAGNVLFTSPPLSSPRMNDGSPPPRYEWKVSFSYDARLFPQIARGDVEFGC